MNGPILVTGGTGTLGRPLAERLAADGADVRVLSRQPRPTGDDRPLNWAVGDLATGAGLDAAVAGAGAIVHCATDGRHDVAATRQLLAAATRTGQHTTVLPHFVYISIVGVDRIPFFYYRAKHEAEQLVESAPLPWTILRATQFHDLIATLTTAQRRLPAVLAPSGFRFQPVDVQEVAARLAELAQGEPAGRAPDMGGPEVRTFRDLSAATMRAAGWRRPFLPLRLPGRAFRAVVQGANLCPQHPTGTGTFDQYLTARATEGRL